MMLRVLSFHASSMARAHLGQRAHANTHPHTRAETYLFALRSGLKLVVAAAAAGESVLETPNGLSQIITSPLHADMPLPPPCA